MAHAISSPQSGLVTALLAVMLTACGGTDMPPSEVETTGDRARTAAAPGPAADPVAPLVADDGSLWPSMPQAVPADPAARTRAGRYATLAQADQLAAALGERVVRVQVGGNDAAAVEEAAAQVLGRLAQLGEDREAVVLVEGSDLRSAAALVERLAIADSRQTWLVTR